MTPVAARIRRITAFWKWGMAWRTSRGSPPLHFYSSWSTDEMRDLNLLIS